MSVLQLDRPPCWFKSWSVNAAVVLLQCTAACHDRTGHWRSSQLHARNSDNFRPCTECCSAAIRELRARYHPDRHAHLPMLAKVFEEVSTLINTRTDPLLEEDRNQSWCSCSRLLQACTLGSMIAPSIAVHGVDFLRYSVFAYLAVAVSQNCTNEQALVRYCRLQQQSWSMLFSCWAAIDMRYPHAHFAWRGVHRLSRHRFASSSPK